MQGDNEMVMRKRVMTVEVDRIVLRGRTLIAWCDQCAAFGPMVTAEQAAMLTGEGVRHLHDLAEQGRVHSINRQGGVLMICLISLSSVHANERLTELKAVGDDSIKY